MCFLPDPGGRHLLFASLVGEGIYRNFLVMTHIFVSLEQVQVTGLCISVHGILSMSVAYLTDKS